MSGASPFALPAVPIETVCKICGGAARLAGVCDFSRGGADIQYGLMRDGLELTHDQVILAKTDPYSGISVHYYACGACGFAFTPSLDHWSHAQVAEWIYNDDYLRHDPGFGGLRQEGWANTFCEWFGDVGRDWRILDYGAGMAILERKLRERGFARVASYDPFSPGMRVPEWPADFIFLNEVVEHSFDPRTTFGELAQLRARGGVIMLTTELVDEAILQNGIVNWWYCAPRSGHVSFYSQTSMALLAQAMGLAYHRIGRGCHVLCEGGLPEWAQRQFPHAVRIC